MFHPPAQEKLKLLGTFDIFMKVIINFLAYGDFVVTYSAISMKKNNKSNWIFYGSHQNQNLADLIFLDFESYEYIPIVNEIPGIFNIKKKGILNALTSIISTRRIIEKNVGLADTLYLENNDNRNRLLFYGRRFFMPKKGSNIYLDRFNCLFNQNVSMSYFYRLNKSDFLNSKVKSVLINPSSRVLNKCININDMRSIFNTLKDIYPSVKITLLDLEGCHGELASSCDVYLVNSELKNSLKILKCSDLYIGADSMMLHLAYLYKVYSIAVYNKSANKYYSPPHLIESGSYLLSNSFISLYDQLTIMIQSQK